MDQWPFEELWIGANDTYRDNVIRYLGEGGAIIPDGSTVWAAGEQDHTWGWIYYDCVLMDVDGTYSLKHCDRDTYYFSCEIY